MKRRKSYIIQIGIILAFMLLAVIGIMCDGSLGLQRMLSDSDVYKRQVMNHIWKCNEKNCGLFWQTV